MYTQIAQERWQTRNQAKALYANTTRECNSLLQEVMEHDNYQTSEDHIIIDGMRNRKIWKSKAHKWTADLNIIKSKMHACDNDFNIKQLEDDINHLKTVISASTKDMEHADTNKYIFSERVPKPCPQEIPRTSQTSETNSTWRWRATELQKQTN